jgi:uncharacterized protein (TIGR02145 family)
MNKLHLFLLSSLLMFACADLQAQVTIGGLTAPATGAVLDLNSTAKGGLVLSNVSLTSLNDIPQSLPGVTSANYHTDAVKSGFSGAIVYHTGGNGIPAGIYVWNGDLWTPAGGDPILYDAQGNDYSIAKFGDAGWWMTQNLRSTDVTYITHINGTPTTENLAKRGGMDCETTPYYTYPGTGRDDAAREAALSEEQVKAYGLVYNWKAASGRSDATSGREEANNVNQTEYRGVCPAGWHLPSDYEWIQLTNEIDANPAKYSDITLGEGTGRRMKSTKFVTSENPDGSSKSRKKGGFDALLLGIVYEDGIADGYGSHAYFWSSSSYTDSGVLRDLDSSSIDVGRYGYYMGFLLGVRCKKD